MARKVRTKVNGNKKRMDIVQEGLTILAYSHSFSLKGAMLPHNTGEMPREAIRMYGESEIFQEKADNKSAYEYTVYLQKLYTKYVNSKFHEDNKTKNFIKLGQCNEILKEYEDYNGTL